MNKCINRTYYELIFLNLALAIFLMLVHVIIPHSFVSDGITNQTTTKSISSTTEMTSSQRFDVDSIYYILKCFSTVWWLTTILEYLEKILHYELKYQQNWARAIITCSGTECCAAEKCRKLCLVCGCNLMSLFKVRPGRFKINEKLKNSEVWWINKT